jgi:hypothetical protein
MAARLQSGTDGQAQAAKDVLNLGLTWLGRNLTQFSLHLAEDDAHRVQLVKPLGELVLTLELLARRREFRELALEKLCWAWEEFERGAFLLEVLAARPELLMVATILGSFRTAGLRNRKFETFVRYLGGTHYAKALQLPNWRMIDLRVALAKLNGSASGLSEALLRQMWSSARPEPWLIDHDSVYAFTHEVFYVTNFGKASRRYPAGTRGYVWWCLPAWLEIFYRKSDWDVFSELLMVSGCLGIEPPAGSYQRMIAPLAHYGFLPSPPGGGASLLRKGMTHSRREFLTHYHTTLVGLIGGLLYGGGRNPWGRRRE